MSDESNHKNAKDLLDSNLDLSVNDDDVKNINERHCCRIAKLPRKRSIFDSDMARILYSKAFRRLRGKTQIFLAGYDDHMRDRLSHSLEVEQLASEIARDLSLNMSLARAIALGHDVGHCPFGHAAERELNRVVNQVLQEGDNEKIYFKHNWQSLRALNVLLPNGFSRDGASKYGLDLTGFTLWGVLHHTSVRYDKEAENSINATAVGEPYVESKELLNGRGYASLEGRVVAIADEIAQIHHDIEDGILKGILDAEEVIKDLKKLFNSEERLMVIQKSSERENYDERIVLPELSRFIVKNLIKELIEESEKRINELKKEVIEKFKLPLEGEERQKFRTFLERRLKENPIVAFKDNFQEKLKKFKENVSKKILSNPKVAEMDFRGKKIIKDLFKTYYYDKTHFENIHLKKNKEKIKILFKNSKNKKLFVKGEIELNNLTNTERAMIICDYISFMTDKYAGKRHRKLCL